MTTNPTVVQCEHCRGVTFCSVDERKPDGSYGPGPLERCVSCKATRAIAPPESLLAVTQEDIDLVALIWSYARDDTPVDEAIQKSARQIARHRLATHPAPPAQPGREEVTPVAAYLAAKPGERLWAFALAEFVGTMKTALKPFADVADEYADDDDGHHEVWMDAGPVRAIRGSFVLDNYRKAREAFQIASDLPLGTALAAEPLLARQDVRPEAEPVARADNFNGSTAHLLDCIDAFLDLTDYKAFVPHNLDKGSHAYRLLVAARVRLEASIQSEAKTAAALVNALADNAHPATLPTEPATVREEETFSSIIQWGDDTFGHGEPQRIIERAWEEWKEMIAPGADMAIEAADVIIVLLRLPGIAEAIQRKMTINRGREWRLLGDGTGYHVPALSTEEPKL